MKRKIQASYETYTLVIERDPESHWLVGEVVELPGCLTEAPDISSLEAAIKEAIEGYLAVADMDEPQPEYVATMHIRVAS